MASSRSKTYHYGSVEISLENCIIPETKLEKTPSVVDGLNIEIETDLRIVGCEYVQTAGILLKLPQVAMATGQVLFQRFFYSKSFVRHDVEVYAMACLFLAAKIEESPRRIRDVINVFHHVKQKRNNRPIAPMDYLGNTYFSLKNLVIKAERRVLKELGFCVHVQHPHKVVITFLQVLDCEKNQQLSQLAWNFMNDALRTNVFVRYQPETIACACIFLSARQLKIPLPSRPPWWKLFDGKIEDIEDVCLTLLQLYMRPKVSLQTLNKAVDRLKKRVSDKKSKVVSPADAPGEKNTKSTGSTFSQPGSPSSSVSPISETTKSRGEEVKKNGNNKPDSQGTKGTKKSNKTTETRRINKNPKATSKSSLSPINERSQSSSGGDSESGNSSDSDSGSGDSGSSPDEGRRKKEKIARQSRRPREYAEDRGKRGDSRSDPGRKIFKSKSDTNSYRRCRDRSRSPYRRSRSRSRERRNTKLKGKQGRRGDIKGSLSRNGDYKVSDKYEKRGRR